MNLSLVIEHSETLVGTFEVRRCLVLDADGLVVGELPITYANLESSPVAPTEATIKTFRARFAVEHE